MSNMIYWLQVILLCQICTQESLRFGGPLYLRSLQFEGNRNQVSTHCCVASCSGQSSGVSSVLLHSCYLIICFPSHLRVSFIYFYFSLRIESVLSVLSLISKDPSRCLAFWEKQNKTKQKPYNARETCSMTSFFFLSGKVNLLLVKNLYAWEPVWNSEAKVNTQQNVN